MRKMILILCVLLCAGFGLNIGLSTEVSTEVPDSNPIRYQVRTCEVAEFYPDEEDSCFQWVYVVVCGGEYDGHVYEMYQPIEKNFHVYQGLEIVFDTRNTDDPIDDKPLNIIKPNMI